MAELKTILLTGANRGLGLATACELARRGHALVVTARDEDKAKRTLAAIEAAAPGAWTRAALLDLASPESIRAFALQFLDEGCELDVVLHNAGILVPPETRRVTPDGIELTLMVNAVAPLLLTRLLLPAIKYPGHVVGLASGLHKPGTRGDEVDFHFDDPQLERSYSSDRAYKNSKLALLWVLFELERRLGDAVGVHFDGVCPGFVPTTAAKDVHGPMRWMMRHVLPHMPFATSKERAAEALAVVATEQGFDGKGGRYFLLEREQAPSEDARDVGKAGSFWTLACEWMGLEPDVP